ncbi:DUF1573 domain-containing protein [Ferruginibacter sp.]|nr:DUF1573 domain-containing protein [Ferruginibacter sp.]
MKSNNFIFLLIFLGSCKPKETKIVLKNELNLDTLYFKSLKFTDTLNRIIYFKNYTNVDIKIVKIENGCGCTSVLLKDSIVKKNDSLPIQITYEPFKVKDSGNVTKYITFRTNGNTPFRNLIITGYIDK